jgi:signal transduction histidine kinase/DNA-binding response OmpR family regulator
MYKSISRQPFIPVTIFALLLMCILLFMQKRADNSIRDMQQGNRMSTITFQANNSLQEIINNINIIESAIRQNTFTGERTEITAIDNSIKQLNSEMANIREFTASKENQLSIDQLYAYINEKTQLYHKILYAPSDVQSARQLLNADANKILNDNIYVAAQKIQLQLENSLQSTIEKNAVVSSKVLKIGRWLTMFSLAAILLLATLIIRHLYKKVRLIDDLKMEKQKTQDAANVKEQFLANMSHEIRTPVNAITGFASLLGKTNLKEDQREFVTIIKTAGNNLYNIVNDILDISKIEAGMLQIYKTTFNLKELIYEIEMLFAHQINQKNLTFTCNINKDVPVMVNGDAERLTQVLTNLVSNAVKFTPLGSISIDVRLKEMLHNTAIITFSIKDTGIGIPVEKQQTIFERFEQADSETTRNYGGTGLGLAIVKKLVAIQNGSIELNSKEQEGAEFIVSLPYELPALNEPHFSDKTVQNAEGISVINFSPAAKILAVEDNKMNQLLLRYIFQQWKLHLTIAKNGLEALEFLKMKEYDLVLMDIQMPELDGYDTVVYLRKQLNLQLPVIAMTAHALPGEREKCIQLGMNDYLAKPIIEKELISLLNKYLPENNVSDVTAEPVYIDLKELRSIFGNNDQFVKKILEQFLYQFPEEVDNLEKAADADDYINVKRIAHSLKTTVTSVNTKSSLTLPLELIEGTTSDAVELNALGNSVKQIVNAKGIVKNQVEQALSML